MWSWPLLRRWRKLKERPDTEHEQILVRIVVTALIAGYFIVLEGIDVPGMVVAPVVIPLAIGYVLASVALAAHLLWSPGIRAPRRIAGLTLDVVMITLALSLAGQVGAVFYPFYLWVIFGMGFRYGRRYLAITAALSQASFLVVLSQSQFWQTNLWLWTGLWAALVLLPTYAWILLTRLTEALARAEAASQAKGRFLATMSHELRTPLNAVIGISSLLRTTRLDHQQHEMVATLRSAASGLLDLIDDVLDLSRIEAGRAEIKSSPFDLHMTVARIRALLHQEARAKGLALKIKIAPDVPNRLHGIEGALRQILINLIANGIKFTDAGSVTLDVSCIGTAGPGEARLRFEVRDTGLGIPKAEQERIFERFAQVDEGKSRRFGGSGLGLTIARQLAETMGATLAVQSELGSGSSFVLEMPAAVLDGDGPPLQGTLIGIAAEATFASWRQTVEPLGLSCRYAPELNAARRLLHEVDGARVVVIEAGRSAAEHLISALEDQASAEPLNIVAVGSEPRLDVLCQLSDLDGSETTRRALAAGLATAMQVDEGDGGGTHPPRRVLVAEDHRTNARVVGKILTQAGHTVAFASDGEQALDILRDESFDVALIDLHMPVIDGLDVARFHRFIYAGRFPRLVAFTADVTQETREACAEAGFDDVLTKPIDSELLLATIDRLTADQETSGSPPANPLPAGPAGSRVADERVVDTLMLERLRALDQGDGFMRAVLTDFLTDAGDLVRDLQAAAARGDAHRFRDRAHALRSSAAHVGAEALVALCLSWRGIGEAQLVREGATLAQQLETEFRRLEAALRGELDRLTATDPPVGAPTS